MIIYHLVEKDQFEKSKNNKNYSPESLIKDGFIYCSTKDQLLSSANRFYSGSFSLLLLVINSEKVESKIIFEDLHNKGIKHPHIYGNLSLDAIEKIIQFKPNNNGKFQKLPEEI